MSSSMDTIEIVGGVHAGTKRLQLKSVLERYGEIDICHKVGDPIQHIPWVRFVNASGARQAMDAIERQEVLIDGVAIKARWKPRGKDNLADERKGYTSRDIFMAERDRKGGGGGGGGGSRALMQEKRRGSRSRSRSNGRRNARGGGGGGSRALMDDRPRDRDRGYDDRRRDDRYDDRRRDDRYDDRRYEDRGRGYDDRGRYDDRRYEDRRGDDRRDDRRDERRDDRYDDRQEDRRRADSRDGGSRRSGRL